MHKSKIFLVAQPEDLLVVHDEDLGIQWALHITEYWIQIPENALKHFSWEPKAPVKGISMDPDIGYNPSIVMGAVRQGDSKVVPADRQ